MGVWGRRAVGGVILVTLLAIAGWIASRDSDLWQARTIDTLRLGAYDGDVGALEWIAFDKGFFRQVGLDVAITGYPSGNAAIEAMRTGAVDVATAADLVVAKRSFDEPDLRIFADICRYWNKGLVARKDRGIAAVTDLKGKRIGVPATSTAEYNLAVVLALQGLSANDVTIVDLPPVKLVEAIVAGTIDAALIWEPHVMAINRQLGDNAVRLMDGGTEAHLLLVGTQGYLSSHTAATRKLLQGLLFAEAWSREHPQEAKAYLRNRFSLEAEYLDTLWPRMNLAVSLPQEILAAMDSEARWMAQAKPGAKLPDFTRTVDPSPLMAMKPSAVQIFIK